MSENNEYRNSIIQGNCINALRNVQDRSVNMIYLDPPFFTQKKHSLVDSERQKEYSFEDKYESLDEYLSMMSNALFQCKRVLCDNGSIFLHCDKTASHHLRLVLDNVFGRQNFVNEIIWTYKRWSNSKVGLQNAHQVIFFYSRNSTFKFNKLFTDYSVTTNIDQILQERKRDEFGKSVYKTDKDGFVVKAISKKGVPVSDVWDIPFLNPKAKERCGYPTQKPVELLKKIILISTDEGDLVLDPFCGSGTTCVAAKSLNRDYMGIDISPDAVSLSNKRLQKMIITESQLLKKGKNHYIEKKEEEIALLKSIDAIPVQRNSLVDGYLKDGLTPVIIQRDNDDSHSLQDRITKFYKKQQCSRIIVIQTQNAKIDLYLESCTISIIQTLIVQLSENEIR